MDQQGKVANPARGQLNREVLISCPRSRMRTSSRETGSAVPSRVSLLISILRLNLVLTYGIPPEFRGHTTSGLPPDQPPVSSYLIPGSCMQPIH